MTTHPATPDQSNPVGKAPESLRKALSDAARSLESVQLLAGKDEHMSSMQQVREYAASRARVAQSELAAFEDAISAAAPAVALTGDQRVYLAQAWAMLEDYAADQKDHGNDSTAEGATASAHIIKQMLADPSAPQPSHPTRNMDSTAGVPAVLAKAVMQLVGRACAEHTEYDALRKKNWTDGKALAGRNRYRATLNEIEALLTAAAPMSAQPSDAEIDSPIEDYRMDVHGAREKLRNLLATAALRARGAVPSDAEIDRLLADLIGFDSETELQTVNRTDLHRVINGALHRAAPASPTTEQAGADDASEVDFLLRMLGTLKGWSAEDWSELFERQPAITQLVRPLLAASCEKPPAGWRCSRTPGHDGPCAATPASGGEQQEGDAKDAARYRYLRATTNFVTRGEEREDVRGKPDLFDEACDAGIARMAAKSQKGAA